MSKGFIVVVDNIDMVVQAVTLAISLKQIQTTNSKLSIVVPKGLRITKSLRQHFDKVKRFDPSKTNQSIHMAVAYELSPYDQTILVTSDMVVNVDVGFWWDRLSGHDVMVCTHTRNFRGALIPNNVYAYFHELENNELPLVFASLIYFEKTPIAGILFNAIRVIHNEWDKYRTYYLPGSIGVDPSDNIMLACAVKETGLLTEITNSSFDFFSFVNLRTTLQGFKQADQCDDQWTHYLSYHSLPDGSVVVGQYLQQYPIRYYDANLYSTVIHQMGQNHD